MIKYVLILSLVFVLLGCNNYNLGNKYFYLPVDEATDVGYPYGGIIYKSKEKNLFEEIILYGDVTNCISNSTYILAVQKPNKELIFKNLKDEIEFWNNNFLITGKDQSVRLPHGDISSKTLNKLMIANKNQTIKIIDSLIANEMFYKQLFANNINYWIIQKSGDNVMGPLTSSNYFKKRKELGIPDDFNLKTN